MRADLLPTTYQGCLIRVVQECAEVIQAITKLWQYGSTPTDHKTGITYDNVRDILNECNDILHAIEPIILYYRRMSVYSVLYHPDLPPAKEQDQMLRALVLSASKTIQAIINLQAYGELALGHFQGKSFSNRMVMLQYFQVIAADIATVQAYCKSFGTEIPMPDIPFSVIVDTGPLRHGGTL